MNIALKATFWSSGAVWWATRNAQLVARLVPHAVARKLEPAKGRFSGPGLYTDLYTVKAPPS
jgi:hypothetical protein